MKNTKELKRLYRESEIPRGIYQIKNLKNGKLFIGSAMNLPGIINRNKFELTCGSHRNRELQTDWKKYGLEAFEFTILDELKPRETDTIEYSEELKLLEEMWLEKLSPYGDKGYNGSNTT